MKKLIIIFLLTLYVNGFGATWYADTAGNNTVGTSWATAFVAWDSITKYWSGGDTVFAHGKWEDIQIVPPTGGTFSDRTALIGGNGDDNSLVVGGATFYGGKQATGWTNVSGNIYRCSFSQTSGVDNLLYYYAVQDTTALDMVTAYGDLSEGKYLNQNDSLYVYLNDIGGTGYNPDSYTIYCSRKQPINFSHVEAHHTTLYGLECRYGAEHGIKLGESANSDSVFVEHCIIRYCGREGANNAAGIATMSNGSSDTTTYNHWNKIVACTISNIYGGYVDHRAGITSYCQQGLICDSNYIEGLGSGIMYKGSPQYVSNYLTRYNTIVDCHKAIGRYGMVKNDSIYGNVIYSSYPDNAGFWAMYYTGSSGRIWFLNNTIYLSGNINSALELGTSSSSKDAADSIIAKYNIIYASNGSYGVIACAGVDTVMLLDSNLYYTSWDFSECSGTISADDWQSDYGFDVHSTFNKNPGLNANYEPDSLSAWTTSITYGGRTWYGAGAVQTLWETPVVDTSGVELKNMKINGGIIIK